VTALRAQTRLTQAAFAAALDVLVATLRGWEQGRRSPQGAARQLLRLATVAPEVLAILQRPDHRADV
jgi:putative transcriptional regulator